MRTTRAREVVTGNASARLAALKKEGNPTDNSVTTPPLPLSLSPLFFSQLLLTLALWPEFNLIRGVFLPAVSSDSPLKNAICGNVFIFEPLRSSTL